MTRPPCEVADVIRRVGNRFIERYRGSLTVAQLKVLRAIERCRTAALGGHRDQCLRCGHQAISYNSCRNRRCPKCQTNAREKWLCARQQELLPVCYFHLVFSVPHALVPLIWQNKKVLFSVLFEASAATLLEVAANPARLGAEVGFLSILHTWGQTLQRHPHIHCVVPGGGLSPDHSQWIRAPSHFFLPVRVLSRVFRGKFIAGLKQAFLRQRLLFFGECKPLAEEKSFAAFLRGVSRQDLGGLLQTALRRPRTRLAILGPLHTSRSYLKPSSPGGRRLARDVPLEGLCPSQQEPQHDTGSGRVPAPLLATHPSQGLPAHSLLRLDGPSSSARSTAYLQSAAPCLVSDR